MPLTTAQRKARGQRIGSSDVAAILGLSPWQTAADVLLLKRGLVEPEATPKYDRHGTEDHKLIGTYTEDTIAALAQKCLGVRLVRAPEGYVHTSGVLIAHPDRQVAAAEKGQPPVECKDYGIDEGWGEPGTAEVPDIVLVQVCHQMICIEAERAYVARLGRGFRRGLYIYEVSREDEGVDQLCIELEIQLPKWWQDHVVDGLPLPESSAPASMSMLRRVRREPKAVAIDDELALDWRRIEEDAKAIEDRRDELRRRVLQAIGTAEAGRCRHGLVTFRKTVNSGRRLHWKPAK